MTERWQLRGVGGFELDPSLVGLTFESEGQAWKAAGLAVRGQGADGPHGVAALVRPVRVADCDYAHSYERGRQALDLGAPVVELKGTLAQLMTVAAAPSSDGCTWVVEAHLRTSDAEGDGIAKSSVVVEKAEPTCSELARVAFELARDLLAHELLEGLHEGGATAFEAHSKGAFVTEP